MTNLNLDRDEAIVLESEEVLRLKQDGDYDELDHVVLTNKRLYGSYEKGIGLFKKSSTEIYTWSLSDIKIINGQAQAQQITYEGELCLQIQFMQETVYLAFSDNPEETMLQWILEINKLLGSTAIIPPPKPPKEKKSLFARKRTANSLKNIAPTVENPAMKPSGEQVHTITTELVDNPRSQQIEITQSLSDKVCVNCGNKLISGAIFCPICGFKVTSTKDSTTAAPTPPTSVPPAPPVEEKVNHPVKPKKVEEKRDSDENEKTTDTYTQRQQEFAGKIIKCPNCGEILKSFEYRCPICGLELRGAKVSTAVQTLAAEISRLERSRTSSRTATKIGIRGWTVEGEESVTDKSVANIIQNFPIPNTKEDVFEFMVLASANIDPSAVGQYIHPAESSAEKSRKMLSNAWNAKFEQVYQKAKLTFGNSPDFYEIQEIYDKKKKEIKRCKRRPAIRVTVILLAVLTGLFIEIWWVLNSSAKDETKHIEQLEHTVIEVQEALEKGEYKHALRIADSIDYQRYYVEMERKWDIEREYWVDKVLETASENGVELDYTPSDDIDNANDKPTDKSSSGGFISGFKEGLQSGIDGVKESIDATKQIMSDGKD